MTDNTLDPRPAQFTDQTNKSSGHLSLTFDFLRRKAAQKIMNTLHLGHSRLFNSPLLELRKPVDIDTGPGGDLWRGEFASVQQPIGSLKQGFGQHLRRSLV